MLDLFFLILFDIVRHFLGFLHLKKFIPIFGIAFEFLHLKQSNSRQRSRLALTRIVSCVGLWPGPPPVFSGLKLDLGLHRKAGLRMYPQRPLARKRPWFRSICSPGVWKFRATAQQHRVRGQWPLNCTELNVLHLKRHLAETTQRLWHVLTAQRSGMNPLLIAVVGTAFVARVCVFSKY